MYLRHAYGEIRILLLDAHGSSAISCKLAPGQVGSIHSFLTQTNLSYHPYIVLNRHSTPVLIVTKSLLPTYNICRTLRHTCHA